MQRNLDIYLFDQLFVIADPGLYHLRTVTVLLTYANDLVFRLDMPLTELLLSAVLVLLLSVLDACRDIECVFFVLRDIVEIIIYEAWDIEQFAQAENAAVDFLQIWDLHIWLSGKLKVELSCREVGTIHIHKLVDLFRILSLVQQPCQIAAFSAYDRYEFLRSFSYLFQRQAGYRCCRLRVSL